MVVTKMRGQRAVQAGQPSDWWQSAACLDTDPELFFPVTASGPGAGETARAKEICAACAVRRQCLQFALATHQAHGVWGGMTEDERRLRAPLPGAGRPAPPV